MNKARGKSGPLFNFDVHDDVRLLADASIEKDESHAGKVVERSYYQRNKHIFPASRWEVRPSFDRLYDLVIYSHLLRCMTRRRTTESTPSPESVTGLYRALAGITAFVRSLVVCDTVMYPCRVAYI